MKKKKKTNLQYLTIRSSPSDYFHGNPNKYHGTTRNMKTGTTMKTLYADTMDRERKIREAGYEVKTIWEQDVDILMISQDVQNILKDFGYTEPLILRDACYGGRTGACKALP